MFIQHLRLMNEAGSDTAAGTLLKSLFMCRRLDTAADMASASGCPILCLGKLSAAWLPVCILSACAACVRQEAGAGPEINSHCRFGSSCPSFNIQPFTSAHYCLPCTFLFPTHAVPFVCGVFSPPQRWQLALALELTGGGTPHKPPNLTPHGFVIHEGSACAEYLVQHRGVAPSRLLKEVSSYDTVGNAYFGLTIHAIPAGWRKVAVVTSAFHMART